MLYFSNDTFTWWNSNRDWNTDIEGYVLFRKERNTGKVLQVNDVADTEEIRTDNMDATELVWVKIILRKVCWVKGFLWDRVRDLQ